MCPFALLLQSSVWFHFSDLSAEVQLTSFVSFNCQSSGSFLVVCACFMFFVFRSSLYPFGSHPWFGFNYATSENSIMNFMLQHFITSAPIIEILSQKILAPFALDWHNISSASQSTLYEHIWITSSLNEFDETCEEPYSHIQHFHIMKKLITQILGRYHGFYFSSFLSSKLHS